MEYYVYKLAVTLLSHGIGRETETRRLALDIPIPDYTKLEP